MILHDLDLLTSLKCDVCIVGSGPVGSSLAVDLSRRGLSVLVLELGLASPDKKIQSLSDAFIASPHAHHRMDVAVSRSLGGTSRWWGGRCVFLDDIDFQQREYVPDSGWPIDFDDLAPYLPRAAELLGCNDGPFSAPDWNETGDPDVDGTHLERWVNETRTPNCLPELKSSDRVKVLLNATAVGIELEAGGRAVKHICVAREGSKATFGGANFYVLALGGIETARFLLNIQTKHPRLFKATKLGRNYMGHLSGSIAGIRFNNPGTARTFLNVEGVRSFARRRLTLSPESQRLNHLPNVSFWPENASYSDARHSSGILSAINLVLKFPGIEPRVIPEAIRQRRNDGPAKIQPHIENILRDPQGVLAGAADILRQRFRYGRKFPRLFVTNQQGIYPLRFHCEQFPNVHNGIRLSNVEDWLGLRRVIIDFTFSIEEMARIIEAHKLLDRGLRRLGIGELIYKEPEGRLDPAEQLQHLSPDGLHQVGLTRMAENASAGVVDPNCRIFDFHNLFIAGASIFPTSGQAPPTLPAVALAVRLAEHIAKLQGKLPKEKDNFVNNGRSGFFRMSRRKLKGSAWTS